MAESDILLTVAELAVAFAGFATLAGILGQPRSADAALMNASRLRGMLESALVALAFALAPFVPYLFGFSEEVTWRVAAAGFSAASITRLCILIRRLPEVRAAGASMSWLVVVVSAQVAAVPVLLAVVGGAAGESAGAAYVLALFIALFASGVFFLRLAVSLLASQGPTA